MATGKSASIILHVISNFLLFAGGQGIYLCLSVMSMSLENKSMC